MCLNLVLLHLLLYDITLADPAYGQCHLADSELFGAIFIRQLYQFYQLLPCVNIYSKCKKKKKKKKNLLYMVGFSFLGLV